MIVQTMETGVARVRLTEARHPNADTIWQLGMCILDTLAQVMRAKYI